MKKLVLAVVALFTISTGVKAQDSFYEGVSKFDGVEFQERYHVSGILDKEGYYKPGSEGRVITLKVKKTEKGNACAVTAFEKDGDYRGFVITDQVTDYVSFSYSYPGVVVHKYTKKGYVFIDSMLIQLEGISKDGLSYKNIGRIYWVKLTEEEIAAAAKAKEEKKKKMTMKEKVAAAKNFAKNGAKGSERYEKFINTNLDELIKNYLKEMNEKHLAGDKGQEADIALDVEGSKAEFLAKRQAESRELSKRMTAKPNKGDGTGYIVKNVGSSSVKIITGSGSTTTLNPGSSTNYICSTDVYYCIGGNNKGGLIADGDEACDKTINIQ